jgi:hypothetical protein
MRRLKRDKPAAGLPAAVGTGPVPATGAACGVGHDAARQPLVFLGRRTLSKLYLMLHLGRLMSLSGPVRLDTVNPQVSAETCYEHNGIDIHEHPDRKACGGHCRWNRKRKAGGCWMPPGRCRFRRMAAWCW